MFIRENDGVISFFADEEILEKLIDRPIHVWVVMAYGEHGEGNIVSVHQTKEGAEEKIKNLKQEIPQTNYFYKANKMKFFQ